MQTLPSEQPSAPATADACPNCEKSGYAANGWCRFCGYYGVLGRCVDVADWEQDFVDGAYVQEEEADADESWTAAIDAVPTWAWTLIGVLFVIALGMSLVRMAVVPGSAIYLLVTAGLLGLGLLIAMGTHLYAGVLYLREEPNASPLDLAVHPLQIWMSVFLQLPDTVRRVSFLWSGLWILILLHAIVGVPYTQFVDLSAPEDAPRLTMTAGDVASTVASASAKSKKNVTLDEALGDVADSTEDLENEEEPERLTLEKALGQVVGNVQGGDEEDETTGDETQSDDELEPGFVKKTFKAVIIGYNTTKEGDAIRSLVVAVRSGGAWRVAGTVSPGAAPDAFDRLKAELTSIRREQPFVKTELSAKWVEPLFRCRIEAEFSEAENEFGKLEFLKLL